MNEELTINQEAFLASLREHILDGNEVVAFISKGSFKKTEATPMQVRTSTTYAEDTIHKLGHALVMQLDIDENSPVCEVMKGMNCELETQRIRPLVQQITEEIEKGEIKSMNEALTRLSELVKK